MTKHQKLTLLRHLREARRAYQDNMAASLQGGPFHNEAETALNEVNETLSWVEEMPTSD